MKLSYSVWLSRSRHSESEASAVCIHGRAQMSADPSGAGEGAAAAGGAVFHQQGAPRLTANGWLPRPLQRGLRDQHGGSGRGQWRSPFRPKLQFKVPFRVKNQIIALSTDPSTCKGQRAEGSDWQDYVWFQAPMAIKGFSK